MKKYILFVLTFTFLLINGIGNNVKAQDINKAYQYYQNRDFRQAAPEFEKSLPVLEKERGKDIYYAKYSLLTAVSYERIYNYSKAIKYYLQCISVSKDLKTFNNNYAVSCNNVAGLYNKKKDYKNAEIFFIESKEINKKLHGAENENYATICNNLAELYRVTKNYKKAEPLYLEAKRIDAKIFGTNHPYYAGDCNNLAELYKAMHNYKKAETFLIEAKNIKEKIYGKKHKSYTGTCTNLIDLYVLMNKFNEAEQLAIEIKDIREKVYGKSHIRYANACKNLAIIYKTVGNFQKAILHYIEVRAIHKKVYGINHTKYATTCTELGDLYRLTGDYRKGESLCIEAKQIEMALGKERMSYAVSCNNLALLYQFTGNYKKAEPLYFEAKTIAKKNLEKDSLFYALCCDNLAGLYYLMSNILEIEQLYIEAKNIREKVLGKNHKTYALSCNNLATYYNDMGHYKKAEKLFLEANAINKKVFGRFHPRYATGCNNLALLYYKTGNYQKAEPFYVESKIIKEKTLGKTHPDYAVSCNNLALLYVAMGDYQKAEPLYIESNKNIEKQILQSSTFMSEKEREQFLENQVSFMYDIFNSFYLKTSAIPKRKNPELVGKSYNNALNIKGQLLKSATAMRKVVLQSKDTGLIAIYNKMNSIGKILAKQYAMPISKRRTDIKQLEWQKNTLEKELVRKSQNFAKVSDFGKVHWQIIQKSLKKDEAAIEFIQFKYRNNKNWTDSTLYYALILKKDYKYPKAVFLFEQKQLDKIIDREEDESDFYYVKKLYSPSSKISAKLYNLIWQPIEKNLKQIKNIYISPTGILNKIAFDALPYDTVNILSDKYKIIYTTSTAQAINKKGLFINDIKSTVLFGGIEYNLTVEEMMQFASNSDRNTEEAKTDPSNWVINNRNLLDSLNRNVSWSYLPGSLKEAEEIQDIFKNKTIKVTLFKDKKGNEEQFKALENNAPSILHISTHGFYFGDDKKSKQYKNMIDDNVKFAHSKNPLLRSGFILAGGNNAFQGKEIPKGVEDGVLTAAEISHLNFFKTKLVVLSACQTGLGDVKGSEGVYGLQRAFKMAGVEYLLFSLWEVPDHQTKELMTIFYKNWFAGIEIREAFKKAQNQLKKKYEKQKGAAFAWAAFVLIK